MQRRAATVSVAVFLLLAAGAYSYIGVAQQPAISLEDPDIKVSAGEPLTIDGTTYEFTEDDSGSIVGSWVNDSARYTETWSVNDTVGYQGDNYTVAIPEQSDYDEFELREVQTVDRPTVEQNGTEYVIVEEDGDRRLVERDEYVGDQMVFVFLEGDRVDRPNNDNETRVGGVTEESATIEWFSPRTNELAFTEGENTTIGGTPYLAHYANDGTLELTTDYQDYHSDVEAQEEFHERTNGLWGIVILSGCVIALLVMLAFMPSRY